ncbi:MAG: MFS transporter [Chloroflexi bacterium]|nr:MFS transporter [Chloroflexota bacterium]
MRAHTWSSIIYFLYFAAIAAVVPFLALYYQSLGLSGSQIGLLLSVSPLVTLFASPFWTGLADSRQCHRTVLTTTLVAAAGVNLLIPVIGSFALLLLAILGLAFFSAPIIALIDSATLSMLGDRRDEYGRIRLWGTIGWGLCAPLAGELFQRLGLQWMFWIYAALIIITLVPIQRLEFPHSASTTPFWQGLRAVLANRQWQLFLGMIIVAAIGLSAHTNYLALLLDEMGASKGLVGVALTISTIFELPVMFFSNRLLQKFGSRGLLSLAMGVTGLRCMLYAFSARPEFVLAIQAFHGLTFPALWVAGVNFASRNTPPGSSATAQGVLGCFLMGFGVAGGGLLGGLLIDGLGVAGMYGAIGVGVLTALGAFLLFGRDLLAQSG